MPRVRLVIGTDGNVRSVYTPHVTSFIENISREYAIRRMSHVDVTADLRQQAIDWLLTHEPTTSLTRNQWWADLLPSNGPVLGPFSTRDEALAAEISWLHANNIPRSNNDT